MPKQGHFISNEALIKTGYRVLSFLYATYEWDGLHRDSDPDEIHDLCQFEENEIAENLVSLAALARACDDESGGLKRFDKQRPEGVGYLIVDSKSPLTAREACNKIIHATKIKYVLHLTKRNPIYDSWYKKQGLKIKGNYKAPALILNGEKYSKPWKARVEVVPFVIATTIWANTW